MEFAELEMLESVKQFNDPCMHEIVIFLSRESGVIYVGINKYRTFYSSSSSVFSSRMSL